MVREICMRCEVFACQFCPRVVFGHLFTARSTMNFMEEITKEGKNRKEEINRRARRAFVYPDRDSHRLLPMAIHR